MTRCECQFLYDPLKSSALKSSNFQIDDTSRGVVSAAVEQSRCKANMVAQGDGKFSLWGLTPEFLQPPKNVHSETNFFVSIILEINH